MKRGWFILLLTYLSEYCSQSAPPIRSFFPIISPFFFQLPLPLWEGIGEGCLILVFTPTLTLPHRGGGKTHIYLLSLVEDIPRSLSMAPLMTPDGVIDFFLCGEARQAEAHTSCGASSSPMFMAVKVGLASSDSDEQALPVDAAIPFWFRSQEESLALHTAKAGQDRVGES
jgi:hypothetical protein